MNSHLAEPTLEKLAEKDKVLVSSVRHSAKLDVDSVANKMAVEISFVLSDQIEDLDVYKSDFRQTLQKLCKWAVTGLVAHSERCVIFPDCVPGFTLMGFKKDGLIPETQTSDLETDSTTAMTHVESSAIALLIEKFLGRSSGMCLVIDCEDLLITLFPVPDMRKNLKMLGFEI